MARFVKGQSGNPAGKPLGARNKLNEAFVRDLHSIWERSGMHALERLAMSQPDKLVEAVGRTLPRELAVSLEQRGPLDSEEGRLLRRLVEVIQLCAGDADPMLVIGDIEHFLRDRYAKTIA